MENLQLKILLRHHFAPHFLTVRKMTERWPLLLSPVLHYGAVVTAKYAALYDKHSSQDLPKPPCPSV